MPKPIINSYDPPIEDDDTDEDLEPDNEEGPGFEDSMCLKYPLREYDAGYGGH